MLGRHPPVFAPSPGSGPAICGSAVMAASFCAWLGGLLAAEASCRSCCSTMVSGLQSLLTAAASFSDTLVSRVPLFLAVSLRQGALVSRSSAARGALNRLGTLGSCSLVFPAASTSVDPLVGGTVALLLSILLYCCVPVTLQVCHLHLPTSEHLNSDLAV